MSKRILTGSDNSTISQLVTDNIRVYGSSCNPKVIYAVIIADDNTFEGL